MSRDTRPSDHVVELVTARSGGACEGRTGCPNLAAEIHHRTGRQMGGSREAWINEPSNLMHLCCDCHRWVTLHPTDGRRLGWLVRRGVEKPIEVSLYRRGGLVLLDDSGGWEPTDRAPVTVHHSTCECGVKSPPQHLVDFLDHWEDEHVRDCPRVVPSRWDDVLEVWEYPRFPEFERTEEPEQVAADRWRPTVHSTALPRAAGTWHTHWRNP